jgi:hypothetical protein
MVPRIRPAIGARGAAVGRDLGAVSVPAVVDPAVGELGARPVRPGVVRYCRGCGLAIGSPTSLKECLAKLARGQRLAAA